MDEGVVHRHARNPPHHHRHELHLVVSAWAEGRAWQQGNRVEKIFPNRSSAPRRDDADRGCRRNGAAREGVRGLGRHPCCSGYSR